MVLRCDRYIFEIANIPCNLSVNMSSCVSCIFNAVHNSFTCQTTEHFSLPKELHVIYQLQNYHKFYKDSNGFYIFSYSNSNMALPQSTDRTPITIIQTFILLKFK